MYRCPLQTRKRVRTEKDEKERRAGDGDEIMDGSRMIIDKTEYITRLLRYCAACERPQVAWVLRDIFPRQAGKQKSSQSQTRRQKKQ